MRLLVGLFLLLGASCSEEPASVPGRDTGPADTGTAADAGGVLEDGGERVDASRPADAGTPPRALSVLFIGNSYTAGNDLAGLVQAFGDGTVVTEAITVGGARLADHLSSTATTRIARGDLDVVVFQGQSTEPVFGPELFHVAGEALSDLARESGARTVWFSTWARGAGHEIYDSGWTPEEMTEELEFRYRLVARKNNDRVARVGAAWMISLVEHPEVVLHTADLSHPTPAGSELAACIILHAITGQSVCDIAPEVECFDDETYCDGNCVLLDRDVAHCGACGNVCGVEDPCLAGVCGCPAGLTGCSRSCYDLDTSTLHCGACGVACELGELCTAGICDCAETSVQPLGFQEAHDLCRVQDCFTSGYGPPTGHAPRQDAIACVNGDVQTATLSACLTGGPACATAISDHCVAQGAVSGFGPVATSSNAVTFTCVTSATVATTTMDVLQGFASRCSPDPVDCSVASWNYCESLGYVAGFGPIEVQANDVSVVCLLE